MKKWKAILGITAVFLLGMVAGGLVVGRVVIHRMQRVAHGGTLFTAEQITRYLGRRLDLDATQRAEVLKIVEKTQAEIQQARQAAEPAVREAVRGAVGDVRAVLRPDQQEKFNQLVTERFLKGR